MPIPKPAPTSSGPIAGPIAPGAGRRNRVPMPGARRRNCVPVPVPGARQMSGSRTADRVDSLLAARAVPPALPEAASAELREIVARAEARAGL